jgi:ketosteroid isomerase-like protein
VAVWVEGSWVSGPADDDPATVVARGVIVWRKEPDGVWRVAMEHIG